jgi:hypothetical protein
VGQHAEDRLGQDRHRWAGILAPRPIRQAELPHAILLTALPAGPRLLRVQFDFSPLQPARAIARTDAWTPRELS